MERTCGEKLFGTRFVISTRDLHGDGSIKRIYALFFSYNSDTIRYLTLYINASQVMTVAAVCYSYS